MSFCIGGTKMYWEDVFKLGLWFKEGTKGWSQTLQVILLCEIYFFSPPWTDFCPNYNKLIIVLHKKYNKSKIIVDQLKSIVCMRHSSRCIVMSSNDYRRKKLNISKTFLNIQRTILPDHKSHNRKKRDNKIKKETKKKPTT